MLSKYVILKLTAFSVAATFAIETAFFIDQSVFAALRTGITPWLRTIRDEFFKRPGNPILPGIQGFIVEVQVIDHIYHVR